MKRKKNEMTYNNIQNTIQHDTKRYFFDMKHIFFNTKNQHERQLNHENK